MAKVPNQNLDHFSASIISRGRGARTPIYGFGDRCSTIELFPFEVLHEFLMPEYNSTDKSLCQHKKLVFSEIF